MIRALFKKQMIEAFSFLFVNRKSGKSRSKGAKIGMAVLYAVLFGYLGVIFFYMAKMLCQPLLSVGLGWLAFVMVSLVAVILGVVGSVFSTYSSLYGAKDNDLLLAMPIPPRVILLARLAGVYVTGLIYELLVMVPALVVWFMYGKLTPLGAIFSILLPFVLSFFVLTLSCLLGFCVAFVAAKVKRKNLVTVLLALTLLTLYMAVYTKFYSMLLDVLSHAEAMAGAVKGALYPFYQMGLAAEGKPLSMLIFTAMVAALFGLAYLLISHNFLKLATANRGSAKKKYTEKEVKTSSVHGALLRRELKRFVGSSTYMLNCGLGLVMMVAAAVLLLVKGFDLMELLGPLLGSTGKGLLSLIVAAACATLAGMNYITAPSVSLEGRQIWLIHVLPVRAWQVLKAKLAAHLLLVSGPTLLLTLVSLIVVRPSVAYWFLTFLAVAAFTVLVAVFGLCVNLKFCNLDWSSETVPVKQSAAVFFTMFGSWAAVGVLGLCCYLLWGILSPALMLLFSGLLLAAADGVLLWWLYRRGSKIFDTL